jgi:NRPS condensation-like uncharacterized protein
MMARFTGNVPEELLRTALAKVRLKYPMMGARVEEEASGTTRFVFDGVPEFQLKVLEKKNDDEWIELAWGEQKKPFDLNRGPLIKFLLLSSSDSTDLVIICHHIICDGLSLSYLVKDIALLLSHPATELDPLPLPPTLSRDNFSVGVPSGWLLKIIMGRMNRSWKKEKVIFSGEDYAKLYREYWQSRSIGITVFSLPPDMTSAFILRCHEEHVTVNSALTTAFALAQNDMQGRGQEYLRKCTAAVDVRKFLKSPPERNFGLFASVVTLALPSGKGDLWGVARKFNSLIRRLLTNPRKVLELLAISYLNPTLIDATWFVAYGAFENKTALRLNKLILAPIGKPRTSLGTTNLGSVDIQEDSNLKTIFFIPVHSQNYEKVIGIITAGGEMNISIMHDLSGMSSEAIEDFRKKSIDYIERAIGR